MMAQTSRSHTHLVLAMILWIFNGAFAQENVTSVLTTAPIGQITEEAFTDMATEKLYTTALTLPQQQPTLNTSGTIVMPTTLESVTTEITPATPHSTYLLLGLSTIQVEITDPSQIDVTVIAPSGVPERDNRIYLLIGAICTGLLATTILFILIIVLCKRRSRNDYIQADPEHNSDVDDEKGDISGARWVFNDGRQDWLYEGADDNEDNQYVGPLAGKTGKRYSLMDKRHKHDAETFGLTRPSSTPSKEPPNESSGSVGTLEGLMFGEEQTAKQNGNTRTIDALYADADSKTNNGT